MKISYNWLKEYLDFKEDHESIGEKLTSLGLEVEGIKKFQSIPGGLEGVVIGKTKSIKKHPNADRLKITTVDIGQNELIQIICGAPSKKPITMRIPRSHSTTPNHLWVVVLAESAHFSIEIAC